MQPYLVIPTDVKFIYMCRILCQEIFSEKRKLLKILFIMHAISSPPVTHDRAVLPNFKQGVANEPFLEIKTNYLVLPV